MNKILVIGNLCRDPELKKVRFGNEDVSVCDFTVAANDRRKKDANSQPEATFFRCTAWRGLAETIAKYAAKGTKVCVTGPVSCRTFQANDGTTKASMEVQVEDFEFESSGNGGNRQSEAAPAAPAPAPAKDFTPVDNTDLPF